MTEAYAPEIECAPADAWAAYQDELAAKLVTRAYEATEAFPRRLEAAGIRVEELTSVAALGRIPVLSKDELPDLQEASPPFGGLLACDVTKLARIFMSPGPILDPQGRGPDFWGFAPALWACGFRAGDLVLNAFSYHLTPAGSMMDEGLQALGCTVVPGGTGNTDAQVELLARSKSTGYCGTPQFLWTLLERARDKRESVALERAFVSGAPLPRSLKQALSSEFGVTTRQGYGTADVGVIAYECERSSGWHVAPGRIVEVLEPGTGEVVVSGWNDVYPLVRFGTGDRSALDSAPCACGRTTPRLLGFQGRVGEGVKVRGMFVHPRQIARALGAVVGEAPRFQAIVTEKDRRDELVIRVEAGGEASPEDIARSLREELKLRIDVDIVSPGTIPEEAPPILDERTWE